MGQRRIVGRVLYAALILLAAVLLFYAFRAQSHSGILWLVPYLKWEFSTPVDLAQVADPQDIILGAVYPVTDFDDSIAILQALDSLSAIIHGHRDSDSRTFKFTLAACADSSLLSMLAGCSANELCEVEYLLRSDCDTVADIGDAIDKDLNILMSFGWAVTVDSGTHFSVLRENANSGCRNRQRANALSELADRGCFFDLSDFSRRHMNRSTSVNSICRTSTQLKESSLISDRHEFIAGKLGSGKLLMIDRPLVVVLSDLRTGCVPFVEDGRLTPDLSPDASRTDSWIRANVHVTGQPNWIFIKLTVDSLLDIEPASYLAASIDGMLEYLDRLQDSGQFRIHYVTAREMYNIARAAESGRSGDAGDFRDYLIKPYRASTVDTL